MNRIFKYAIFGNDALQDKRKRLRPFSGLWIRNGVKIGITVWAFDWKDAQEWCDNHSLKLDGEIVKRIQ